MAVAIRGAVACHTFHFDGEPEKVLESTATRALALLAEALRSHFPDPPAPD